MFAKIAKGLLTRDAIERRTRKWRLLSPDEMDVMCATRRVELDYRESGKTMDFIHQSHHS